MNASANTIEQALAYIQLGWRPIPIPFGHKIPIVEGWQRLRIGRDEVPQYFGERCNIGVVLGDASGGLVDIDLDSPAAVTLAPLFLPETMAFGRASKPRSHFLYLARYMRTEKFIALDGSMLVEIRANKTTGAGDEGLQTVFPESQHPSGETIQWDTEYDSPSPRELAPEELRNLVARLAAASLLVSLGWTHDRAVAFAKAPALDALAGIEEKGVQRIARWLGMLAATTPRTTTTTPRSPHLHSRDQILKRARAYLEKVDPAISGAGGHQTTWGAALAVARGFDLSESEALEVIGEYNSRCQPPWSQHELEHKVRDALNAERVGRGWLLEDRRPASPRATANQKGGGAHAASPGVNTGTPTTKNVDNAESSSGGAPLPLEEDIFPTRVIGTVPDEGPAKWLVRDLWLEQGVGIIGGEPKSFKSFVSTQLAVCVASGKPMFGRYEVQRGRVLAFNAEDRPTMTRNRAAQMCRALDVDFSSLDLHLIDVPALRLDDMDQTDRLTRTVAKMRPTLLILDPLRDLHGADENDAGAIAGLLAPLRILQRSYGCAVMLVHHMAKATEISRRAGQRLRGSSALHGWVDSALYLTHKDGAIVVTPEHRAAPAPDPFPFKLEQHETPNGSALWLDAVTSDAVSEKEQIAEDKVLAVLGDTDKPLTLREIRTLAKQRGTATDEAVKRLVKRGVLTEEPVLKGNSQPVPGYRL